MECLSELAAVRRWPFDHEDELVEFAIAETPLGAVASKARVVGSFVERLTVGKMMITIAREDPQDAPHEIDLDRFEAGPIGSMLDYDHPVITADTDDHAALRSFVNDYVLLVPVAKVPDHHINALPAKYAAIFRTPRAPAKRLVGADRGFSD